ncbi:MAG TPA: histidinol dehydrogenase [Cytophagaceae bacterium]
MEIIKNPDKKDWPQLLKRPIYEAVSLEEKVSTVLKAVKGNGDAALKDYTFKFDGVQIENFKVSTEELEAAGAHVSDKLKSALNIARINLEKFHIAQREPVKKIETMPGVVCWRKSVPISKVGLYIPGGTAPLFSTILMLGVPANIAGCEEIVLCTPPDKNGHIHPAILYTAHLLGIENVYKVGGAQAIAAMAYGTETIPSVYKIFGPGNQFVTAAKQLVAKEGTAIDMPAGPSEVAVLADENANASFVASDLLSQAEHGPDSQVLMVSDDLECLQEVIYQVELQLEDLPRKDLARTALTKSKFVLVNNLIEGIHLINEYCPEHLILHVENTDLYASKVVNAGSVFLGSYTPEAAGDYASGTNHTLPTNGHARAYSGVSLDSFVKKITFQQISPEGIKSLGPVIEIMAENEQLFAHKNAVTLRLKDL